MARLEKRPQVSDPIIAEQLENNPEHFHLNPGFDGELTTEGGESIFLSLSDLVKRLNQAAAEGNNPELVAQIQALKQLCDHHNFLFASNALQRGFALMGTFPLGPLLISQTSEKQRQEMVEFVINATIFIIALTTVFGEEEKSAIPLFGVLGILAIGSVFFRLSHMHQFGRKDSNFLLKEYPTLPDVEAEIFAVLNSVSPHMKVDILRKDISQPFALNFGQDFLTVLRR